MCQGDSARDRGSQKERRKHINHLELKTAHMAVIIFRRETKTKFNPLRDEQSGSISVHKKHGSGGGEGKGNQKTNKMGKILRQFLIENAITIIVEYIPAKLNTLVENESQKKDNNE